MSAYKQISVKDTKEMIATDIYLLDIRDQESLKEVIFPTQFIFRMNRLIIS